MKKVIAISGVPGTGKTVVAHIVAKKTGANLIEIKKLIGKEIKYKIDKKRNTKIVDISSVQHVVSKHLKNGLNIIEGHYAHLLKADRVIVLRTSPAVLERRLKLRKWSIEKIHENIECELLDEITQESLKVHSAKRVFEIDTTKRSPYVIADKVIDLNTSNHRTAYIDWTKNYAFIVKHLKTR
jgi:adenylate kinase